MRFVYQVYDINSLTIILETEPQCFEPITIISEEQVPSKNNLVYEGLTLHKEFLIELEIFATDQASV